MLAAWLNKSRIMLFSLMIFGCEYCFAETSIKSAVIDKIAKLSSQSHIVLGVTAIHIEKNEKISYHGDLPFIMASTVKLPIAVAFLHHVDANTDSLNNIIRLRKENLVPGSGKLYRSFRKNSLQISLRNLIHHMMIKSDNTATDAVLKKMKGPKAVLARLQSLGFNHIKVNRTIMQLFIATNDVSHMSGKKPWELRKWESTFNKIPLGKKTNAWRLFQNDLRDTTTADDMAILLTHLYQNKLISPPNTKYLLSLMEKCETGKHRIKALLPPSTKVAHKTGTWAIYSKSFLRYPGAKNLYRFAGDVGIITLPHNKGHIAIAVYVKSTAADNAGREELIAKVAREIYDYYNK